MNARMPYKRLCGLNNVLTARTRAVAVEMVKLGQAWETVIRVDKNVWLVMEEKVKYPG